MQTPRTGRSTGSRVADPTHDGLGAVGSRLRIGGWGDAPVKSGAVLWRGASRAMCALALGAGLVIATPIAVGAGDEEEPPVGISNFVVRKVVSGPATEGSTIQLSCVAEQFPQPVTTNFNFDATGNPTTVAGFGIGTDFQIVDGTWHLVTIVPLAQYGTVTCSMTEILSGGAVSTAWTCDFDFTSTAEPEVLGCEDAAGTGVGPVVAVQGNQDDDIEQQTFTVMFTNTYVAQPPPPVIEPTFTG